MAKMNAPVAMKYKPSIDIDSKESEVVKDLKIGDEVTIKATGRVKSFREDRDYSDEKSKEKIFHASLELSDIEMDNTSMEDKDEAEGAGIETSAYKRAKKSRERAIAAKEEKYGQA